MFLHSCTSGSDLFTSAEVTATKLRSRFADGHLENLHISYCKKLVLR